MHEHTENIPEIDLVLDAGVILKLYEGRHVKDEVMEFIDVFRELSTKIEKEMNCKVWIGHSKETLRIVCEQLGFTGKITDDIIYIMQTSSRRYSYEPDFPLIRFYDSSKMDTYLKRNKIDLKKADIKKVEAAFPQYKAVGISAEYGHNMDDFYRTLFKVVK